MIPNAEKKAGASEPDRTDSKQVEIAIKELKKQIEQKRAERITRGLKDADGKVERLALGGTDDQGRQALPQILMPSQAVPELQQLNYFQQLKYDCYV